MMINNKNIIKKRSFKFLTIMLALLMSTSSVLLYAKDDKSKDEDIKVADGYKPWEIRENSHKEIVTETTYFDIYEDYEKEANTSASFSFDARESLTSLKDRSNKNLDNSPEGTDGVKIPGRTEAKFEIDVPEDGIWHLALKYKVLSSNIIDLKINVRINNEKQYFENDNISLPSTWKLKNTEKRLDNFKNQIYPVSEHDPTISTQLLNHDMFNLETPLLFKFKKGKNIISFTNNELEYELININLLPKTELGSYSNYLDKMKSEHNGDVKLTDSKLIKLEAEDYTSKNRAHIRGDRTKDHNYHPYSPEETLINIISPQMWQAPGDAITYKFNVEKSGYYRIGFRAQQGQKRDMPVYKNIYIDNEIPFEEFHSYAFPFTRSDIKNEFLHGPDGDYMIYLAEGEHVLKLESTASNYYEAYELLSRVISEMNQLTLDIKTITGNRVDKNREWNIEQYIPEIRERLTYIIDSLRTIYNSLNELGKQENSTSWNNLRIIEDQIRLYLTKQDGLDDFVNNLDGFSQRDGSLAQQVSSIIEGMLVQPLTIDQIYIAGEDLSGMPKKIGFFQGMVLNIQKFLNSFKSQSNENLTLEEDALNIWINRPVTHIDVLREMINQNYQNKNIKINISAMPDENRLLLAIIGGNAPDGVLGLSTGKPYDFALRGAAYDLRNFDDFSSSVADFTSEMFVPFAYDDGIYAFPETTTFNVLFYRTDILQKLGLEVPRTWEDLINVVPALDRNGMNIQTTVASNDAYKNFGATVPIIQQHDGRVYNSDGRSVAFDNPKTLEAFELLTDLYVKFNLPYRIVNFYNNFKSGVTPIGVSELNTYTLLKYAAPEIRGQWAIAPNIGMEDKDGNIINTQPDVTSSTMITQNSNKKEEMWEFMKWWMSADTQLQYGNELQMRFGKEYVWSSANLQTIANAPYFEEEDREIIYNQIFNAREIPRHPAYFQVERELSNAWNTVVFDGISVREALDKGALSSNRIMISKLQEFGYLDNEGNILKDFEMPSSEKVRTYGNFADVDKVQKTAN